jgi:hypothetical protein
VADNFQTGNNKIKLLMEYENVTKNVWLPVGGYEHPSKESCVV